MVRGRKTGSSTKKVCWNLTTTKEGEEPSTTKHATLKSIAEELNLGYHTCSKIAKGNCLMTSQKYRKRPKIEIVRIGTLN